MNNMKKIFFILPLFALLFSSCDDILAEESFTEVGKENYVTNSEEAENVLLGIYRHLSTEGLYSYHLSLLFTISTDIAQCEGSGNTSFRVIPTNSHNPSTTEIATTWAELYNAVYDANDFIETVSARMAGWGDSDRLLAEIYLGEARALRALYYFDLVRWYGNVVLMTSTADSRKLATEYVQASPEEVYAFIEADLKYAAEVLPWAQDDTYRANNAYRFSKGAALGLLAKVYVTWAGYPLCDETKWEEAAKAAQRVVESGKHQLNSDYEQVWRNTANGIWDPNESLIEVSFYSPTGLEGSDCVGRIGKWNGVVATAVAGVRGRNAGNWKVTYNFTGQWEKLGDPRCELSIANYRYGYSNSSGTINTDGKLTYFEQQGVTPPAEGEEMDDKHKKAYQLFTPAKWDTEKYVAQANALINNDKSNVNWYILRYSDVLLLYAEALNEWKGPQAEAFEALNIVRRRGFGDNNHDITGLDQEGLRQAIRQERAYELCFEGHRKQDLIRWGVYYSSLLNTAQELFDWYEGANYSVIRYTVEGRHELLPIPQRDLDLMTQCKQNPNWGM